MKKKLTFTWEVVPGAEGYRIYRSHKSQEYIFVKQFAVADISCGTKNIQTVCDLTPGLWYFVVTAYNIQGIESPVSNEVSVTVTNQLTLRAPEQFICVE